MGKQDRSAGRALAAGAGVWCGLAAAAAVAQDSAPGPAAPSPQPTLAESLTAGAGAGGPGAAASPPVLDVIPLPPGDPGPPESRESEAATVLDEVVVTAQKTRQTLREVPASVTAISGEQMRDSKILSANDVNGYVPNTQIKVSPFTGEVRIRGYGTPVSNVGFEPSVGVVIDDVYYGRTAFLSSLFYDVDRFEVVRGPQGALFGKNTVAGVINIATVDADSTPAGDFTVFGRDDLDIRDARGGVSVPLADDVFSRVSGAVQQFSGLYYNTALDRQEADLDSIAGRAKLRVTHLLGDSTLRLAVSEATQKANGNLFQLSKASEATLNLFRRYDPQVETDPYNRELSSNVPSRVEVETRTASAIIDVPLSDRFDLRRLDLSSVSAWARNDITARTIDFDYSPAPVVRLDLVRPTPYEQFSQEFKLTGSADSLFGLFGRTDFIAGVYYLDSTLLSNDLVRVEDLGAAGALVIAARGSNGLTGADNLPLNDQAAAQLGNLLALLTSTPLDDLALQTLTDNERAELLLDQHQRAGAAYGQVTTYLTEHFAGIAGYRYGREKKKAHLSSQAPQGAVFIPAILGQSNFDTDDPAYEGKKPTRSETENSPKLGVKYDFSKKISTYAIWAKGFKGGGYNALPFNQDNIDYGPERASSYEVGLKTRLFDSTLDFNFAAYLTNFDDLQVSVFDGTTFKTENAASARSQGVELDFRWLSPFPGTSLRGTMGYNDAYYRRYDLGPAPATAQPGDPGTVPCSDDPTSRAVCQDLAGRTLVSAPHWSASLIPTLSLPGFSDAWGFQFQFEALYTGPRYLDVDLDPNTRQRETIQLNARASIGARTGAWSFSVLCQNITEQKILQQVADEPVAPGNYGAVRGDRGREFYGAVKLNF